MKGVRSRQLLALLLGLVALLLCAPTSAFATSRRSPHPEPTSMAAVLQLQVIPAERAAQMLHELYPHAHIHVDSHANALVVVGPQADVDAMRTIVQGIDVKNPTQPATDIITLKTISPRTLALRLHPLFPDARINVASKSSLLVRAPPLDMTQIKALAMALDTPMATPTPTARPVDAIAIHNANPRAIARAVAHAFPDVRISVSGANMLMTGDPDTIGQAKDLASSTRRAMAFAIPKSIA